MHAGVLGAWQDGDDGSRRPGPCEIVLVDRRVRTWWCSAWLRASNYCKHAGPYISVRLVPILLAEKMDDRPQYFGECIMYDVFKLIHTSITPSLHVLEHHVIRIRQCKALDVLDGERSLTVLYVYDVAAQESTRPGQIVPTDGRVCVHAGLVPVVYRVS